MYPLKIILIGCPEPVRGPLRQALGNQLAVVETELGDVPQAARLRFEDGNLRLFLVYLKTAADLEYLRRLHGAFPDHAILGLRDAGSDQSIFTGALRAGAAFVVSVPVDGEDLAIALGWIAKQFGFQMNESRLIAVSGVTGGCGATSMALNLAGEIVHSRKLRTILVDLSLRMGTLATCLNVEPKMSIRDLLDNPEAVDVDLLRQTLTPIADKFDLLPGPQHAVRTTAPSWPAVHHVVRHLKPLADVVVLHVPCTYEDLQFDALAAADQAVLLLEQKVPAVRALQMVRQSLLEKQTNGEAHYVINRYDPRLKGFTCAELEKLLHVPLGTIAEDSAQTRALNQGVRLREAAPGSRVLADLNVLLDRLVPAAAPATRKAAPAPTVFGRLVGAFGLTT